MIYEDQFKVLLQQLISQYELSPEIAAALLKQILKELTHNNSQEGQTHD